jgi:hypothetical protein
MQANAPRADESVWRDRVERWQKSGLSGREFAEREGVKLHSLSWWKWELRRRAKGEDRPRKGKRRARTTPAEVPSLLPVLVQSVGASVDSPLELVLRSGLVVRVPRDFDEASLARLVRVIEGA